MRGRVLVHLIWYVRFWLAGLTLARRPGIWGVSPALLRTCASAEDNLRGLCRTEGEAVLGKTSARLGEGCAPEIQTKF
jgi:hypothetical protein